MTNTNADDILILQFINKAQYLGAVEILQDGGLKFNDSASHMAWVKWSEAYKDKYGWPSYKALRVQIQELFVNLDSWGLYDGTNN